MRKLATIRRVEDVTPIENADAIECLKIDGWRVVSKKDEAKVGDLVVYFEIDSFLPASDKRFTFLMSKGTRVFEGVEGVRLKTIKLRGQISQGLALPLDVFPELRDAEEGDDVTDTLGILKYERHEPLNGAGNSRGTFPWFIRKTDEERIQNISTGLMKRNEEEWFLPTLKLDGSSTTVFYLKDERYFTGNEMSGEEVGICSRNQLLNHFAFPDNHFVRAVLKSGLIDAVIRMGRDMNKNIALQGETIGPGVVRSWEKVDELECRVFSIFDIDEQQYFTGEELLRAISKYELPSTVFYEPIQAFKLTKDELLKMAEGPSLINKVREGLVFKQLDGGDFSFKAISNKFLLKVGE